MIIASSRRDASLVFICTWTTKSIVRLTTCMTFPTSSCPLGDSRRLGRELDSVGSCLVVKRFVAVVSFYPLGASRRHRRDGSCLVQKICCCSAKVSAPYCFALIFWELIDIIAMRISSVVRCRVVKRFVAIARACFYAPFNVQLDGVDKVLATLVHVAWRSILGVAARPSTPTFGWHC